MNPLISARGLAQELADPRPPVVIDVSYQLGRPGWGREQYDAGHVPGAHFVDVETELSAHRPDGGGRHPLPTPEAFQRVMRRCGVRLGRDVVVLDQGTMLAAGRLWWLLRHHGHDAVRVLDGGMAAWRRAGGAVTTEPTPEGAGDFVAGPGRLPTVDADQIPSALATGRRLFDVRAAERYAGLNEPIDPVAGHIPGAVNLPAGRLLAEGGGFAPVEVLRRELAEVRPGDILSCGSGLTASQVALACEAVGTRDVAIYPGSWSDWITEPTRPVVSEAAGT
ncbi:MULTISPECIES: sulfurtransferase [unclassified Luteococcus]|uniref:sulfurtransferase n=1 Tax=unclassified Luteococcus TaxID=2639923 RepID=UPI00313EC3E8